MSLWRITQVLRDTFSAIIRSVLTIAALRGRPLLVATHVRERPRQHEGRFPRWKCAIGGGLRSRTNGRQTTEVAIAANALNRMLDLWCIAEAQVSRPGRRYGVRSGMLRRPDPSAASREACVVRKDR
jgi:hypothetical protein